MLLNVSVFMWYGAVCLWESFVHNKVVSLRRLVLRGVLVLLLWPLPWVYAVHRFIHRIGRCGRPSSRASSGPWACGPCFTSTLRWSFCARRMSTGSRGPMSGRYPRRSVYKVLSVALSSQQPRQNNNLKLPNRRGGLDAGEDSSVVAPGAVIGPAGRGSVPYGRRTIGFPGEHRLQAAGAQTVGGVAPPEL